MYQAEQSHWWYRGMERVTRAIIERWYAPGMDLRILDAGCGTGGVMEYMEEYGNVTGIDFAAEAMCFCRERGKERVTRASLMAFPFSEDSFDLIVSFDVLCERGVPDDMAALREFARALAPGGRVLIRVPAYNWLRGQHDEAVHIRERYTLDGLGDRLRQAGLVVEHRSYANALLFPVALAKRLSEKVWPPKDGLSDLAIGTGPFNGVLKSILALEAPFVARTGLPFGLSVVVVGRKPDRAVA